MTAHCFMCCHHSKILHYALAGIKAYMFYSDFSCVLISYSGVYPSVILPYHLQTSTAATENLQCLPLLAEIKAAVGNLRAGYSRIIRLCRCVSQVLQCSGR